MIRGRAPPTGVRGRPAHVDRPRPEQRVLDLDAGDARRTTSRPARPTARGGSPAGPPCRSARSLIGGNGEAELAMLEVVPAGPDADLDAAAAHLVDGRDDLGEDAGMAERDRRHEHAEADPLGLAGQAGDDRPGVGRRLAGLAREAREVVRRGRTRRSRSPRRAWRPPAGRRSSSPAGARSSGRSASGTPACGVNH